MGDMTSTFGTWLACCCGQGHFKICLWLGFYRSLLTSEQSWVDEWAAATPDCHSKKLEQAVVAVGDQSLSTFVSPAADRLANRSCELPVHNQHAIEKPSSYFYLQGKD